MLALQRLFVVLLLVGAAGCAGAQQATAPPPSSTEPAAEDAAPEIRRSAFALSEIDYPELPDFEIPQPRRVELDNGLVVFLIEDRELPMISASARIGTGSVFEPADKVGLASITGDVMRSGGTTSMPSDSLDQFLEDRAATIETGIGESSGSAYLNTLKEHIDEVLPLFVDVLRHPAFAEEKVQLTKTQAKSAIARRNDDPSSIASREFNKLVYSPDSPYARVPQYYTIDAITRDDLTAFHAQYFHPNNMLLSVWGDFDADSMAAQIQQAFADWPAEPGFERPELPPVEGERQYSVNLVEKDDVTQSTILMGYPGEITADHPDYYPVIIMNEVLSGGFTSRLFKNVRTDQGLAYSVGGQYSTYLSRPGQFYASVGTKSESTVEAVRSVLREIEKMREAAPTAAEVQLAKDSYLNSFVFNFDTRQEIVGRLMTYEYYGYPADFLEQTREGVEAVTPEDVFRVAQQYLHPAAVDILVVGNPEDFDQPLSVLTEEGTVNQIDITIPTQPPGETTDAAPTSEAALSEGRQKLQQVAEALGGAEAFAGLENIRTVSKQTAQTPGGEMQVDVETVLALPARLRVERRAPMGNFTVVASEQGATVQTPQGTQQLPASAQTQIQAQLWRDLAYLLANWDDPNLQVQVLGTETVEEQTLEALRLTPPAGEPYTLYLDPATARPVRMDYQGQNPMTGAPVAGQDVYSNYQDVGQGLMLPFTTITYQDGEEAAVTTTQEMEINTDLPNDVFQIGS